MRPEFAAELRSILQGKDDREEDRQRGLSSACDKDEDFTQGFQEILKTRILPQFENVVEILSDNCYPAEVRVIGSPGDKTCYLTFSNQKVSGNWALHGGEIVGPRMAFQARKSDRNVAYVADYKSEKVPRKDVRMGLNEVTSSFVEEEIRQLFRAMEI